MARRGIGVGGLYKLAMSGLNLFKDVLFWSSPSVHQAGFGYEASPLLIGVGYLVGLRIAAMMLAGLDGIQNKLDPGQPLDKDLYDLEPEEEKKVPTVCSSLEQALDSLDRDRDFLKAGGVFSDDLIDAYIALKMGEMQRFRMSTHPVELDMYYSL